VLSLDSRLIVSNGLLSTVLRRLQVQNAVNHVRQSHFSKKVGLAETNAWRTIGRLEETAYIIPAKLNSGFIVVTAGEEMSRIVS